MSNFLPTDDNNHPIPALRFRNGGAHKIVAGASSTRNSVTFDAEVQVVSLYASVPVYLRFGGSGVVATTSDHYFPAGVYYDVAIGGEDSAQSSFLAVLRADTTDGMVYLSEKI